MKVLRYLLPVMLLISAAAFAPRVEAHAVLVKSTPADGSTITAGKVHFSLQFNSRIDAGRSQLSLSSADGKAITLHSYAGTKPSDLDADAEELKPGDYVAHWQALATDGHITRGSFRFTAR